jgi:catechol 2,3-dioxygenase-like lactoylglutathione lyase family enzyme
MGRWKFWTAILIGYGVFALLLWGIHSITVAAPLGPAAASPPTFASTALDLGAYVSNVEASAKFYVEAIGMTEVPGFSVPDTFCTAAGLTDGKELKIRVFTLGSGEPSTKFKIMQVPGVETKTGATEYVHSQFGYRYITIHVADLEAALARLRKAGVTPLKQSPVVVPESLAPNTGMIVVKDPDGNMIEIVGSPAPQAK